MSVDVKVRGGELVATASYDPGYPGIDIEFVADNNNESDLSRPRVLFESPKTGKLRVLVWADKNSEDYTHEIEFDI